MKSLEIKPDSYTTMSSLMVLYFDNNKFDEVAKYAEEYVKLHESDSSNLCNLIDEAYRLTKNYEKCLYFLQRALELDSSSWAANLNLAELHMNMNNYEMAVTYLYKAKKLKANHAPIYNELGISYYVLGHLDSALQYADIAIKLEKNPIHMINKGVYLIKMDSIDSGCIWLTRAESLGKNIYKIYGLGDEAYELALKHCKSVSQAR